MVVFLFFFRVSEEFNTPMAAFEPVQIDMELDDDELEETIIQVFV